MSRDSKSNYYDAGGIETLDIIKAKLTPEQYTGYLLGNSLKYQCRMMHKSESPTRDAEKAANYSKWLSEVICERNMDSNSIDHSDTIDPDIDYSVNRTPSS